MGFLERLGLRSTTNTKNNVQVSQIEIKKLSPADLANEPFENLLEELAARFKIRKRSGAAHEHHFDDTVITLNPEPPPTNPAFSEIETQALVTNIIQKIPHIDNKEILAHYDDVYSYWKMQIDKNSPSEMKKTMEKIEKVVRAQQKIVAELTDTSTQIHRNIEKTGSLAA